MAIIQPPDISLPPPSGKPGGLGDKLEVTLIRFFGRLLNSAKEALAGVIRFGFETFLEAIEPDLISLVLPVIDLIEAQDDVPPEVRQMLTDLKTGQHQVGSLLLNSLGGSAVGAITGNILGTLLAKTTYALNRKIQPARLDFGTLWLARNRSAFPVSEFMDDLADQGWSPERIGLADLAAQIRPGVPELLTLWLRQEIDDPTLIARLIEEGVPPSHIPDIQKLAQQIPGPGDLVRFALREAWRDDIAARYGYDEDYVGEFGEWMTKQGYSDDWARKYWRAHWELPSITLGMEMVHRRIITEAEFDDLLRVSDIPAGWRDKVTRVIYSPYTRVDSRRMHKLGVLQDEDLVDVYKDQGYDQEHAENMALFTIRFNQGDDRDLTKADVLNGYRDGLLSLAEARDMLVSINFSVEAAAYLLARVDAQQAKKLVDAEVRVIKDLYLNGDLTLIEAQTRLTGLGLPARQIELYLQEWKIDREGKVKRPTRGTLERLYKSGAITQEEFTTTLDAIGYQPKYVGWYLTNIALERQAEAEKEEERARKERERVEKDKRKTAYQRDKARLDVEIAEVGAAISAADVALVEAQNSRNEALRASLPLKERAAIERDYMIIAHDADAAIGQARIVVAELRDKDKELRSTLAEIDQSLTTNIDVAKQVEIKAAIAGMRTAQARFTDAAAMLRVEIAKLKEEAARETDESTLEQMALDLLALQTQEAEEKQAITDVEIDIREAVEQLGATMEEARRAELETEQATVKVELADISERIAGLNSTIAETAVAKTNAQNAMDADLSRLPGAAEALEIHKHFDTLIERIKAQVKELRVRLSGLRVQKALLTFEYQGPAG